MRKQSRFRLGLSTLLLICLALSLACRPEPPAQPAQAPQNVSIRLAWVPDMAEAGIFVAREKGIFQREGLVVDVQPGGFGLDPLKLVASGGNDFGIAGAGNLLLAREQGLPVVAIAAEFQATPVGFVTRKESGIVSFADFRGRRVGIQTGADTDVLYRALLSRNNMTSKDVKEVPIQYDMSPFVSNQIDVLPGYVTNQPITLRSQGVDINVLSAASLGASYYGNVLFTTEEMIKKRPEVVRRFVLAFRDGWALALADKEAAKTSLMAYTKDFRAEDLDQIYDAVMPFIRPGGGGSQVLQMDRERWASTYQILKDAGLSKEAKPVESAFTVDFLPRN